MKMKTIGVTGGIGSGKSTVSAEFKKLGALVIDADLVAHEVMEPDGAAFKEIVCTFGDEILTSAGLIDRKHLADVVFSKPQMLAALNRITHPAIYAEIQRRVNNSVQQLVCLDVPLLFDSGCPLLCDATIAVIADHETRVERVMLRDGCTRSQVEARMAAQMSDEEMRSRATFCIINNGTQDDLTDEVLRIYKMVME